MYTLEDQRLEPTAITHEKKGNDLNQTSMIMLFAWVNGGNPGSLENWW